VAGHRGHVAEHDREHLVAERLPRAAQADGAAAEARVHQLGEILDAWKELAAGPERLPVLMGVHADRGSEEPSVPVEIAALARPLQRLARFRLRARATVAGERVGANRIGAVDLVAKEPARHRVEHDVDEDDPPVVDHLGRILARIALRAREGGIAEPPLLDVVEARHDQPHQPMLREAHGIIVAPVCTEEQVLCPGRAGHRSPGIAANTETSDPGPAGGTGAPDRGDGIVKKPDSLTGVATAG